MEALAEDAEAASEAVALAEAALEDTAEAVDLAADLARAVLEDRIIIPHIITILTDISGVPAGAGVGDRGVGITVPAAVREV